MFDLPIKLNSPHLRVFSAIFSNLAAGFIILALGTKDQIILISDIIAAIFCVIISIRIEKILEEL